MQTLGVRRAETGTTGAHGNTATTYAAETPWRVIALAPGASEEPRQSNRDVSEIEWTVYAHKSDDAPTENDLVVVGDDEFTVEGRPADWTLGGPGGGIVVELRRVEG